MEPSEFLKVIVAKFDALSLRYYVVGSMATSQFGEPRFTNDVDVVLELTHSDVLRFAAMFPPDEYYCSTVMIDEALRLGRQFNVIHPESGFKFDAIVPSETPFGRSEFERRVRIEIEEGCEVWFATPEDTCLKKLVYLREGGSDKHVRDVAGVIRMQGSDFDRSYCLEWARRLDLADLWDKVVALADSPYPPPGTES